MNRCKFIALAFIMLPGCAEVERLQAGAQSIFVGTAAQATEDVAPSTVTHEQPVERTTPPVKAKPQLAPKDPWMGLLKVAERHCARAAQPSPTLLICDLKSTVSKAPGGALDQLAEAALLAKSKSGIAAQTSAALYDLERELTRRGLQTLQRNTSPTLPENYRIVFERRK